MQQVRSTVCVGQYEVIAFDRRQHVHCAFHCCHTAGALKEIIDHDELVAAVMWQQLCGSSYVAAVMWL
jgi:hypothetical protein